jgi:aspartyl-tRNA(Asn)/glutamyl-tRNA(Gln) amidotransferase subunit A
MDEFAMGSSTETSYFGPTLNPVDKTRVPGGSSGGSAAAVADDEVIAALGSDTGGSIRQPASFCGIVGLKPTYGLISRYGLLAMASSLDQIGTLTKTVEDSAILLNHILGADDLDSTSVKKEPIKLENILKQNKNIKIGVPKECFSKGINKEVEKSINDSIASGQKYGFEIEEINLQTLNYALSVYYIIMPAEVSANLARFDGIKYGYSNQEGRDLLNVYLKSRAEGFGAEVKRRIMLGTYTLSAGYYDAYYKKAQKVRALIKKEFESIFAKYDQILMPTSPTTAFKLGEKLDDPLTMYLSDIYTVPVNIAGLPAISIPCGKDSKVLPIGLQIVGSQWSEEKLLNTAYQFESLLKR